MKAFKYLDYKKGDLPISEKLSNNILSLPMHPYLCEQDIQDVVQAIIEKL